MCYVLLIRPATFITALVHGIPQDSPHDLLTSVRDNITFATYIDELQHRHCESYAQNVRIVVSARVTTVLIVNESIEAA